MERKELESLGFEKDAIDKVMEMNGADIEREKAKVKAAEGDRDKYKEQYETATGELSKLRELKPEEMQATIEKLQEDLKAKDKEYAEKEAERLFTDTLTDAIKAAGGRNPKSVMPLLDIEGLRASKNQGEDIKKALETVKESDAYLFGADEPIKNPVGATGGSAGGDSALAAMRAAAGLPPEK